MTKYGFESKTVKQLLKRFPKFNQKLFVNIVTGDEIWVNFFKPVRTIGNKRWLTNDDRRPVVAKKNY